MVAVKTVIQYRTGLAHGEQRLVYGGKQLAEDRLLVEYGVQEGSTLHMLPRLRGGEGVKEVHLVNANVTSMRAHADDLLRVQAELLALQEVRLTEAGQRAVRARARDQGWDCLWGKPLESPAGGVGGASQGGVGLLL